MYQEHPDATLPGDPDMTELQYFGGSVGWRGLFYLINRITLNRLSVSIN
jgi:hypothetical protein